MILLLLYLRYHHESFLLLRILIHIGIAYEHYYLTCSASVRKIYGLDPSDHISQTRMPKLHTSQAKVYSRYSIASGAVHLTGILPVVDMQ